MRLYSAGPRKDLGTGGRVRMDLMKEDLLEFRLFELFSHPHKAKHLEVYCLKILNQDSLDLVMTIQPWVRLSHFIGSEG